LGKVLHPIWSRSTQRRANVGSIYAKRLFAAALKTQGALAMPGIDPGCGGAS
jgi:hypothetical protein